MSIEEIYKIYKDGDFKDTDIKRAFNRCITTEIVMRLLESQALLLSDHINKSHGGRRDKFAASMGVMPQQVSRWLKYECIWFNGAVYKQQSKAVREEFKLDKGKGNE